MIVVSRRPPLRCALATTAAGPRYLPLLTYTTLPGRSLSIASSTGSSRPRGSRACSIACRYSADVAVRALRLFAQPGQPGPLPFEPGLDAHDVAIGLELRERQVEEVVRFLVAIRAHEVGGHVVRRAERRTEVERPAGGELGDRFEAHERAPRHHRVPQLVDATSTCPPGELRVLTGRQLLVMIAGELRQLLDHDGPRRHVDPDGKRLGGEHHLDEPLDEAGFDDLLERRHHPRVMRGQPGLQLGEELPVAEHRQVARIERSEAGIDDLADAVAIVVGREAQPGIETRRGRLRRTGCD